MGSRPRSDEAAKTRCSAFGKCGACQLLNVSYEKQLADKEARIQELFANVAPRQAFRPIMGMDEPFHYRNKVIAPYAPGMKASRGGKRPSKRRGGGPAKGKERVLTGMYAPGTHDIIPTDGCLLENEAAKAATLAVRDLMLKWDIPPYDEDTGRGFIRHVVARAGRTGELLVTVVTNGSEFPSSRSFCRELVRRVPEVTTVVQNVNTRMTNVILGEEERTL